MTSTKRTKRFPTARLILALAIATLLLSVSMSKPVRVAKAAAFTGDNLVIYRVGPGSGAGGSVDDSATQVFLDEYTLTGTLVQSIPMPTTVSGLNKRLTATGSASSEGLLTRSTNGLYLVLAGYNAAPGTQGGVLVGGTAGDIAIGNSHPVLVNRVVARVDHAGNVDTTTALTDAYTGTAASVANVRGVTSTNGTDIWLTGTGTPSSSAGIRYTTLGATTSTQLSTTPTNLRGANIFDGQLYVSASTGTTRMAAVGIGTPTTSGQTTTNLPGFTTTGSPYAFYFADLTGTVAGVDTLYVAFEISDEIQKWSLVGGSWTMNGSYALSNPTGLTGFTTPSTSSVTLFATNVTDLYTVTDTSGYNVAPTGTVTSIATRPVSNIVFRGVAFAPLSPTAASSLISGTITDSQGKPVAGTVVNLSGSQNRKTITNARGYYQFDNVETAGFYTVTPSRANYSFSPSNRAFSQLGNQTEAAFTGSSSGDNLSPLDTPEFFVRQQYVDVLGREPDEGGFNYWSDEILHCGIDAVCIQARRTDIAAAFFVEQEFQQTGSFIYGLYQGSLGRRPAYGEYAADRSQVVGSPNLEADKAVFAESFVQRPEFVQKYQGHTTAESFVDALLATVWQSANVDLGAQRGVLLALYHTGNDANQSRSLVLQQVLATPQFKQAEYNRAFVLTEYFAYLRRDPEPEGYAFWLNVLNNREPGNFRGMVCSFITSAEYQQRFSQVVTHSNAECGR